MTSLQAALAEESRQLALEDLLEEIEAEERILTAAEICAGCEYRRWNCDPRHEAMLCPLVRKAKRGNGHGP